MDERIQKVTDIARLYYEKGITQSEIATQYNISRPLVNRMLKEAKQKGIVQVIIRSPEENMTALLADICYKYGLNGGTLVARNAKSTSDKEIALGAISLLSQLKPINLGVGWGNLIGTISEMLESKNAIKSAINTILPLIGNSNLSNRNYHSNELVRIFATHFSATPTYLYAPAIAESIAEADAIRNLNSYDHILSGWQQMDTVIMSIENYPTVPDFASAVIFDNKLMQQNASCCVLLNYFTPDGSLIKPDNDYAIQVPLTVLKQCKNVIGVASNVRPKALSAALNSGLFTHIVVYEELARLLVN